MPRAHSDNGRVELRLRPEDKATLTRAASLKRLDLTGYILGNVAAEGRSGYRRGRAAGAFGARLVARPGAAGKSAGGS